jgi:predicted phage tail protein
MEQSSSRTVKITLHGSLAKFQQGVIEVIASTPYEAIKAMCRNYPQFHNLLLDDRPQAQVLGYQTVGSLQNNLISDELHLVPAFCGAGGKTGGFIQIVIGAALIAASVFYLGPAGFAMGASIAMGAGVSMVLGGIMTMMTPVPNRDSGQEGATDPDASKYLGSTVNTVRVGTRIPILYGEYKVGGHYISFDIQAIDVAV